MYCYYSITTLKSLQVAQLGSRYLLQFIDGIKKLTFPTLYQVLLLVFSARVCGKSKLILTYKKKKKALILVLSDNVPMPNFIYWKTLTR